MNREDARIARGCGFNEEESRRAFEEAAISYDRMTIELEALYRRRMPEQDNDGETLAQMVERYRMD